MVKVRLFAGGVVFVILFSLCIIILRARHDHNKIAPCGMIKGVFFSVFLKIELNRTVSQDPQHFSASSETQATHDRCFACQSVCSVISFHSSMSRAIHPQMFSKVDVDH